MRLIIICMAQQLITNLTKIFNSDTTIVNGFRDQSIQFFQSSSFWEVHGLVLTIDWFVVAFFAILLKRKFQGTFANLIHTLLFLLCNVTTLYVNYGAGYRLYPQLSTFEQWPLIDKVHAGVGVFFTAFLIIEWLGGIRSLLGGDSYYHKKLGYVVSNLGKISVILGMLQAKQQRQAMIFAGVLVVELLITLAIKPKQEDLKSKIDRSVGNLKSGKKRD